MNKLDQKLEFYRKMLTIRLFEEKALELFSKGLIMGSIHVYIGEEAVAVGFCSALKSGDNITSTHRGHGHVIAMGGEIDKMMAELLGRATGYCKGRGGSMHIASKDIGVYGSNGIVAGGIPIACGLALSYKMKKEDKIALTFFGDGAANEGVLYESLNLSSVWNLPIVFVCENNLYAQTTPALITLAGGSVAKRASGFNIESLETDGNDIEKVYEVAEYAIDKARSEKRPLLIEAKTYRFKGHWQGDPEVYRTKEEVEKMKAKKDPIKLYKQKLIEKYNYDSKKIETIEKEVKLYIKEAEQFAIESPQPDIKNLFENIYSE